MDLEKLMMSKAIMDRHSTMSRGQGGSSHMLENFDAPQAKYNINPELLSENIPQSPQMPPSVPKMSNQMGFPKASPDAIQKSKLPDEIKKLMMEHPIEQPGMSAGPTLSDELIEKASKLMGTKKPTQTQRQNVSESVVDNSSLRAMMKDVVREVLRENGMLTESVEKTNDRFTFQVGKHIFEGKLTKVKKLS
jgi:hypothetical protein